MTKKHKILKADLIIQTLTIGSMGLAIPLNFINDSGAPFFAVMVFVLAGVQVLGALTMAYLYDDKRRKKYLKVLFWMHGMGTLVMAIIASLNIEILLYLNRSIFVINWLISPFFLAIWSLVNSFKSLQEYEAEANQEFV